MKYGQPWIIEREKYRSPFGKEWQRWFAWYPIRTESGQTIWLEEVEWRYWDGMTYTLPEYREITK